MRLRSGNCWPDIIVWRGGGGMGRKREFGKDGEKRENSDDEIDVGIAWR